MNSDSILVKVFDYWKVLVPVLSKFPRQYKFSLGERMQNQASDVMEILVEAYYSPRDQKKALLARANIKIEILRRYIRLAFELGLYSSKVYERLAASLNEIGRMTGGWMKSL